MFVGPNRYFSAAAASPTVFNAVTDVDAVPLTNVNVSLGCEDLARSHVVIVTFEGFDTSMGFTLEIIRHFESVPADVATFSAGRRCPLDEKYTTPLDIMRHGNPRQLYLNPITAFEML